MAIATFTGKIKGFVKFLPLIANAKKTEVTICLRGLRPGSVHAIHIHEYGDLRGGCKTTGGHWNPTNTTHGSYQVPSRPRHLGDLINNVEGDPEGKVCVSFVESGYEFGDLYGRAIVLHTLGDDLGLQGVSLRNNATDVVPYSAFSREALGSLCRARGYFGAMVYEKSREELLEELNAQSLKTGNAGGRMTCAVIGRANAGR